jgi:hypothetical protein
LSPEKLYQIVAQSRTFLSNIAPAGVQEKPIRQFLWMDRTYFLNRVAVRIGRKKKRISDHFASNRADRSRFFDFNQARF